MKRKLTSRKFLLALGASLTALGAALTGELAWNSAVLDIVIVVSAYVGAEGVADAAERYKKT